VTDADAVASFLFRSPEAVCLECLAWRTGLPLERVEAVLGPLHRHLRVTMKEGNCTRCLRDRDVLAVAW